MAALKLCFLTRKSSRLGMVWREQARRDAHLIELQLRMAGDFGRTIAEIRSAVSLGQARWLRSWMAFIEEFGGRVWAREEPREDGRTRLVLVLRAR